MSLLQSDDEDHGEFHSQLVPFEQHNSVSLLPKSDNEINSTLLIRSQEQVWKNISKGGKYILHVPNFYNEWLKLNLTDAELDRRISAAN